MVVEQMPVRQEAWFIEARAAYLGAVAASGLWVQDEGESQVTLRDGSRSCVYIDHGDMLTMPETAAPFDQLIAGYVHRMFDTSAVLLNVDSKSSSQLTGAVAASEPRRRQIVVLPPATTQAEQGTNRRMRLPPDLGRRPCSALVVLDDVANSGDTIVINVVSAVRGEWNSKYPHLAVPPVHLVGGVARKPEVATTTLAGHDITLHAMTTLNEVLDAVWPDLSAAQHANLADEFPGLAARM